MLKQPVIPVLAPLRVTFHGGLYMDVSQEAIFTFHCDPSAVEVRVLLPLYYYVLALNHRPALRAIINLPW